MATTVTKRAMERKLKRLQEQDFVRSEMLKPERGGASPRAWCLCKRGSEALGVTHEPRMLGARGEVTPRQAAVLNLLAEMKHLSTTQIRQHLHGDKQKSYTWQLLHLLQQRGYIRSQRLYPERGAASECYWTLRKRGADAIGRNYDRRYLRRPARRTIEHRGLLLEMVRQVEEAGWLLHKPIAHSRQQPGPVEAPQRRQLVEAVLKKEEMAIENLLRQGYPVSRLRERIERLRARQVGAVVPRAVNDYVAYRPDQPEQTALLIPHSPWAGRGFWTRQPGARHRSTRVMAVGTSRIKRYSRLTQVVPVIAVFNSNIAARQYADLLAASGFYWVAVEQVGEKLTSLLCPTSEKGKEQEATSHEDEAPAR